MGYIGYSRSERAAEAERQGARPMSRWTAQAVREEIAEQLGIDNSDDIKLLAPFREFLAWDSWHHTGALYSQTDFYKIASIRFGSGLFDMIRIPDAERQRLEQEAEEEKARQARRKEQERIESLKRTEKYICEDTEILETLERSPVICEEKEDCYSCRIGEEPEDLFTRSAFMSSDYSKKMYPDEQAARAQFLKKVESRKNELKESIDRMKKRLMREEKEENN